MAIVKTEFVETTMTVADDLTTTRIAIVDALSDDVYEDPWNVFLHVNNGDRFWSPWVWGPAGAEQKKDRAVRLTGATVRLRNQDESAFLWRVELTYQCFERIPEPAKRAEDKQRAVMNAQDNPTAKGQKAKNKQKIEEREDPRDATDKTKTVHLSNSADQPLEPQRVERTEDGLIIHDRLTSAEKSSFEESDYLNHVNDFLWAGYDPYTLRCVAIESTTHIDVIDENNDGVMVTKWLYPTTFEFEYRKEGWATKKRDLGTFEKSSPGTTPVQDRYSVATHGTDAGGGKVAQNKLSLDGSGSLLDTEATPNPTLKEYHWHEEADFSQLPIAEPSVLRRRARPTHLTSAWKKAGEPDPATWTEPPKTWGS